MPNLLSDNKTFGLGNVGEKIYIMVVFQETVLILFLFYKTLHNLMVLTKT